MVIQQIELVQSAKLGGGEIELCVGVRKSQDIPPTAYQGFIQDFWWGGGEDEVCGGIATVCVGVHEHAGMPSSRKFFF